MGYQVLHGVTVVPLGGAANRYVALQNTLFNAPSKAFGGWIYNASVEMGFSQQPTTITLDISLDTQDQKYVNNTADFDITREDLKVGGSPDIAYYSISFGGAGISPKIYRPMFLVSYEISGSADSKTLKVKFVDYSIILDKIYIAIFKKQAYDTQPGFIRTFSARPKLSALCPGCSIEDSRFYEVEVNGVINGIPTFVSKIESAAYFFNHKNTSGYNIYGPSCMNLTVSTPPQLYKNFYTTKILNQTFSPWNHYPLGISNTNTSYPTNGNFLDLNGGTVVLGTEEFNQSLCGSAAEVSYNFTELITVLAKAGLNFSLKNSLNLLNNSAQIKGIDKNSVYRKNYNGTLREVLGNWCADFGLDFYVDGTRIHFVDLSSLTTQPIETDMDKIVDVTKTSSTLGAGFNSNTALALGSFTESADISDTYEQRLITFRTKPRSSEQRSKEKKNHCGFQTMHPLDILNVNITDGSFRNMYDKTHDRPILSNVIWSNPKKHFYTNRSFETIDRCSAIGKYSSVYRNIYAGSLLHGVVDGDLGKTALTTTRQADGFNSLAFIPLYKLGLNGDEQAKLTLIEKVFKQSTGDKQKYIVDHRAFDVFVGMRNDQDFDDIIKWERSIADNMYKYGVLVKGPKGYHDAVRNYTTGAGATCGTSGTSGSSGAAGAVNCPQPFVPEDFAEQLNSSTSVGTPPAVLNGVVSLLKLTSSSTPQFERHRFFDDLPFKDIFQNPAEFLKTIVMNLPFASLDNDWGTVPEIFDDEMKVPIQAGCNNFAQPRLLQDPNNPSALDPDGYDKQPDSFSAEDFQPRFEDLPDDMFEDDTFSDLKAVLLNSSVVAGLLGKLLKVNKSKSTGSGNYGFTESQCPRLQLMIVPRVTMGAVANTNTGAAGGTSGTGGTGGTSGTSGTSGTGVTTAAAPAPANIINPHLLVTFKFGKGNNAVQEKSYWKRVYLQNVQKTKEFKKDLCEYSLEEIVCNQGVPKNAAECIDYSAKDPVPNPCVCVTPISDQTNPIYKIGFTFPVTPTNGFEARRIDIRIDVHQGVAAYDGATAGIKPLAAGGVGFLAIDEDYPVFQPTSRASKIIYPVESDSINDLGVNAPLNQSNLYQGVLSQSAEFKILNGESVECYGPYWCGSSNVAKIQVINNEVSQDIAQLLQPSSRQFYSPVYDMQGNQVVTVQDFHTLMSNLTTDMNHLTPARNMSFDVIGNVLTLPSLLVYLQPSRGLKSLSFSLSPEGFRSKLSFSNRALKLPKPEAIINKIRATF